MLSLAFPGRGGLWLVLLNAGVVVVVVAGGYCFLLQRGPLRWLALVVGVPVGALVFLALWTCSGRRSSQRDPRRNRPASAPNEEANLAVG